MTTETELEWDGTETKETKKGNYWFNSPHIQLTFGTKRTLVNTLWKIKL